MPPVSAFPEESTFAPMFRSAARFQTAAMPSETAVIVPPFSRSALE